MSELRAPRRSPHPFGRDEVAGREAADRLVHDWPDTSRIADATSAAWARAALARLVEHEQRQPALFRASREGSERGAESLSPRPFQGLLEVVQNADDLGAGEVRVMVRGANRRRQLTLVHDGAPVQLAHVGAMVLPWVSTKSDDPTASGRFGIGQRTLTSLGGPLHVHCAPFHFVLEADGPHPCAPLAPTPGIYDPSRRETLLSLKLNGDVDENALRRFLEDLGPRSLVFLKSVRRVRLIVSDDERRPADHLVTASEPEELVWKLGRKKVVASRAELRSPTGSSFVRYISEVPVPAGDKRHHKATGPTTAVGVATERSNHAGGFYDRVPLPLSTGFPVSINAQWDPDTARGALLPRQWNEHRLLEAAQLTAAAAADCLRRGSSDGWRFVPLLAEMSASTDTWLATQLAMFVEAAHAAMEDVRVPIGVKPKRLSEVAWEDASLDGLLTDGDQHRLKPDQWAVPRPLRDAAGRWRTVLREIGRSEEITVQDALELFDLDDAALGQRDPSWYVGMARAALTADVDLVGEFLSRRSVLLADGRRVEPPDVADPHSLVCRLSPSSLAAAAGTAFELHPAYLEADDVLGWLKEVGVLLDNVDDDVAALRLLAREDSEHSLGLVRLNDQALIGLRTALERLAEDEQRDLSERIGHNIELRAVTAEGASPPTARWARPAQAYLPRQIDRDTDSFARAAASTAGLTWLDPAYARLLRRAGGRVELGAQRFLVRLGAATSPRLVRPPDEEAGGKRDTRLASPVLGTQRPALQVVELRAIGGGIRRTHLLDDRWSPDLDAVIADIQMDRNRSRRRRRSFALLAVVARSWDRLYADHATADAVYLANGYWQDPHPIIATWLARAASEPWLISGTGALRAPSELALPTEANQLVYGRQRAAFLAAMPDTVLRSSALIGLRLRRGPAASELVDRLQQSAGAPVSQETRRDVLGIYALLAIACAERGPRQPVDDLTVAELRASFDGRGGSSGLVLSGERWYTRGEVFAGPAVFGDYRPFAPSPRQLEPLWRTLELKHPGLSDALGVLREVARHPLRPRDRAVVIETYRLVAEQLAKASPQLRSSLRRMPLWTGSQWRADRPVFATTDPAVAGALAGDIPVWESGFASYEGLTEVVSALGVTVLSAADFQAEQIGPDAYLRGEVLRPQFALAVQHLRDALAAGDDGLYHSLSVSWEQLQLALVMVDENMVLAASLDGRLVRMPGRPQFIRDPFALATPSADDLGTEAGGRAIGSLFSGDQQKVAWAWSSMWARAQEGTEAEGITLSSDQADEAVDAAKLVKLQALVSGRRDRKPAGKPGRGPKTAGPITIRPIKDIEGYEPDSGTIVNAGQADRTLKFPVAKDLARPPDTESNVPSQKSSASGNQTAGGEAGPNQAPAAPRTVLPPTTEREQLALDAVVRALQLNPEQIVDLRARRGMGADAVDELRHLYEIKMESGPEFPSEVTLKRTQVQAAQEEPDFFLAVVCGLEDADTELRVRFIFDPLHRLGVRVHGEMTLTGIANVEALEYRFAKRAD